MWHALHHSKFLALTINWVILHHLRHSTSTFRYIFVKSLFTTTRYSSLMARASPSSTTDVLLYFLAIFVPPASVFVKRACAADFWINILLFILGWIPGVIHAWWIISKYPDTPVVTAQPNNYQHVPNAASPPN